MPNTFVTPCRASSFDAEPAFWLIRKVWSAVISEPVSPKRRLRRNRCAPLPPPEGSERFLVAAWASKASSSAVRALIWDSRLALVALPAGEDGASGSVVEVAEPTAGGYGCP